MNWAWWKSVLVSFIGGAVVAVATMATTLAADGFTLPELKILGAAALAGGLSGAALLFKSPPRDPDKRDRATDRMNLDQ